jgi:membrane protein DedA with SNARE-associated domain
MTLAGSFAQADKLHPGYIFFLALIGTLGKTIGSYVLYVITGYFEDIITSKFGKFVGINQKMIDNISSKLGKGWKDFVVLVLLRAAPIIPTAPVSIVAGLIKVDLKTYLLSTAVGVFFRNVFYLYLGYTSIGALEKLNDNLSSIESAGYVIVLIGVALLIFYIWKKRKEFDQQN